MRQPDRLPRGNAPRLESLEDRNLLSIFIAGRPTINVLPGRGVTHARGGAFSVVQPATIQVFGSAQPNTNVNPVVGIFATDNRGNVVNGGQPLAVTTTNPFGQYSATVQLPSTTPRDVNFLYALEAVSGPFDLGLKFSPTTLTGLTGSLAVNGTTLTTAPGALTLNPGTISNPAGTVTPNGTASFNATLSGATSTIAAGGLSLTTPAGTPVVVGATPGSIGAFTSTNGAPITSSTTAGTLTGPITVPSSAIGASTSTLAGQTGSLAGLSGTVAGTAGTFTQTGSANISGATATGSSFVTEFAASDPLTVYIHQGPGLFFRRLAAGNVAGTTASGGANSGQAGQAGQVTGASLAERRLEVQDARASRLAIRQAALANAHVHAAAVHRGPRG